MCDALFPLSELALPKKKILGVITRPSVAAGILFVRKGEKELFCRAADLIRTDTESRILIAANDEVHVFQVLSSVLTLLLDFKMVSISAPEFKTNRLQGDILRLTQRGSQKVVRDWYPKTATEADRLAVLLQMR